MFGRKTKKELAELNERLTNLFKLVEDDHNDLQNIKIDIEANKVANQEVVDKVAELESRQHTLRSGLQGLVAKPTMPLEHIYVDHIHVDNNLVGCEPEECIYCHPDLNTHNNNA